jgi:diguanylate cyclase (GGDEF)-like protein
VNDTFGHGAGDIVLQELATLIRKVVRAEDIVARYGGEEFCVLLPEIPIPDAEQVAERLRVTIESHVLPRNAGTRRITVSVGMATLEDGDEEGDLFRRADLAMYEIKRLGGNGVCIATVEGLRTRDGAGARRRGGRRR